MTTVDGSKPRNMTVYKGETVYEGTVLAISGSTVISAATSGAQVVGIADVALVDQEGTARTSRDGELIGVHILGSGHIVRVKSTAVTYTIGEGVYAGNTSGYSMDNGAAGVSSYRIGTSLEAVTASAGDLVTVILDSPINTCKGVTPTN